ncbi:MAG TPA: hypothetical protein PLQ57_06630 [Saprospiraceae bacterium]|nr:hypothetical protein [Saprospiraceae bacterium]
MKQFTLLTLAMLWLFSVQTGSGQAYPDRHSNVSDDAWLSSTASQSPNTARGSVHWIRYDLGETYAMHQSRFWNINTPGLTNAGANFIIIDYSIDGLTWYEWGRYTLPQSNGSTFYEGVDGPDFSGLVARFVLINVISNHGHANLRGLAEIKIDVSPATVSVKDNLLKNVEIKALPNPFSSSTTLQLNGLDHLTGLVYQCTDATGKLVANGVVNSNQIELSGQGLVAGVYYFSLIHAGGIKTITLDYQP